MLRARPVAAFLCIAFVLCVLVSRGVRSQSGIPQRITHTTEEGNSLNPSLSGDGRRLAFESTEDIARAGGGDYFRAIRADVSTATPTFLQMGGARAVAPALSQDGSVIAFAAKDDPLGTNPDGNSEIFLFDRGALRQITNTSPGNLVDRVRNGNFQPSISDDGRFIAFSSNRDLSGLNADGNLEIFVFDATAHSFTQITNSAGRVGASDAKISGNGRRVAYILDNGSAASAERDLVLFDRTGGTRQVIADNVNALALTYGRAISDDGMRVVYAAETAENTSQVFLFDGRSGNLNRQITSLNSRVTEVPLHPTISGDGLRLAFASRRNVVGGESDGSVDLYTFDIPTTQFARVTNAPAEATAPVVSSLNDTGTLIAFSFPRVLTDTVTFPELRNNSEIYMTRTAARPEFGVLTVLNGASFGHEPSTTKAVAPDSIAVGFGGALANSTEQAVRKPDGTYPTSVGGTTVKVNGRDAQIFFVSPALVKFLVPAETLPGTAEVVVTNSDGFRTKGTVSVMRAAPGVFTFSEDGLGEGRILDAVTHQRGPFDPTDGQRRVIIYATGVRNALETSVTIGGRSATVESIERSTDMPGQDEIRVLLPADLRGAGNVDLIVRADNRSSNPVIIKISGVAPRPSIVINEVLADPPPELEGDANRDGVRDTSDDEFVEIVNATNGDINIGSFELLTRGTTGAEDILRHTFAPGTILPARAAIVVFGGGAFNPNNPAFGGAQVVKASTGRLSLVNAGGVVTLRDRAGAVVSLFSYGGSTGLNGSANQSLTRSPDVTGNFTLHQSAENSAGRLFSPGTHVDGSPFLSPPIARIEVSPATATIGVGQRLQFMARAFDANNQVMSGVLFLWRSSNNAVATIDEDGVARGVSQGTTDIRAFARGVQSGPARLTVKLVPRVLTRVEVTPSSSTIPVGGEQQFTARAFDQFDNEMTGVSFTFSSSNTAVATIDATGLAKGLARGTTTITATAQNVSDTATLVVTPPTVVINEVLADPPEDPDGDANHDGLRDSSEDEFVEIVNSTASSIDISGWTLRTRSLTGTTETKRHTFADGTSLPARDAIVVFGGAQPGFDPNHPAFGGAQVVTASTGRLSLTNSGLHIIVRDASGKLITQFTYGSEAGHRADQNQSLTRSPDITGEYVPHTTAAGAGGRKYSPGTKVDGSFFVARAGRLTTIKISPTSKTVYINQTTQFTAQALDQFGRTIKGLNITFSSSNTSVATIESVSTNASTGVATATVMGRSVGTAQIRASATQGSTTVTSDPATLNVAPPPPRISRVEVTPDSATINRGRTQQFTARAYNASNQVVSGVTFTWTSSDESIATVNQSGLATGVGIGTVTITATAPDGTVGTRSDQSTLNVQIPLILNEILADPATGAAGDANRDGVTSSDDDEFVELVNNSSAPLNISGIAIFETTSPTVARFTFPEGTVLAARQAAVVFGGGGANFDPNNPAFGCSQVFKTGSLSLGNSSETVTVQLGSAVVASHSYGAEGGDNQSLTRSPDLTGAFTKHTLAAGSNGRLFSPGVKVDNTPFGTCPAILTSITINPPSANGFVGQTTQFTAQALDQFGRTIKGLNITFSSSNTSVATIESVSTNASTGVATATVMGRSVGTAQIRASATQGSTTVTSDPATFNVAAPPPRVSRVEVTPDTAAINRGHTQQFTATAFNASNQVVSGVTFTWTSSDTSIATVNQNGLATGVGIGTATITATAPDGTVGTRSDQSTLDVRIPLLINEILADPPTGAAGDANRDGATNSDDDEFVELVNNSNASVDISNVVIADATSNRFTFPNNTTLAAGRAVIVFGGGSPPANDPAFGGALVFTTGSLGLNNTGDTVTIKIQLAGTDVVIDTMTYDSDPPETAADHDQSLTRSPDLTGAFVQHTSATNSDGRAFSPGTRVDGTPFGSPAITRIAITPVSATVDPNDTQTFTAQAFSNAGGPEVEVQNVSFIWNSTSTSVATVSPLTGESTTATAHASGSTTIEARAGGQLGTATLNVTSPPPVLTSVAISPASATIGAGDTQQFTAQARDQFGNPIGGVTITFASNNTAVATVDSVSPTSATGSATATVTGHSAGSAEIRATADDGTTTVTSTPATLTVTQVNAGDVVISEFRFRGSNGANDEFIELYNRTTSPIDISGYKIYRSNGSGARSLHATIADGVTLGAGCHYLLTNSNATGPYNDPVTGDQTYGTGVTDDGGIAFTRPGSDGTTGIIDQVGLSAGSAYKEGTNLTSLGNTTAANIDRSYERKPGGAAGNGQDTDNNFNDFALINPSNPQNSLSGCVNTSTADLSITKTDSPDPVITGSNVTYTITVTNNGPGVANSVVVTDDLPNTVTFVSCSSTGGGVCNSGTDNNRSVTFTSLDIGESAIITLVAKANGAGGTTIENTASVSSATTDPVAGNNSDTEATAVSPVPPADLSITKTDSPDPVNAGENITYTLTVKNNTASASAENVTVTDAVPAGTTFVSVGTLPADWTRTDSVALGGTGTITFKKTSAMPGTGAGSTAIFTITVKVDATAANNAVITNRADVSSDTTDDVPGNNFDEETTTVRTPADVSIPFITTAGSPNVGEETEISISLRNDGPYTATNVIVHVDVPAGLEYVPPPSISPGTTYDPNTGDWTIPSIGVNTGKSLTLTFKVLTTGNKTITAEVTASDQFDPDSTPNNHDEFEDDYAFIIIFVRQADLSLTKTVNNETPNVGDNVVFTVTVHNDGFTVNGVKVTDQLPAGLTFFGYTSTQGAYDSLTGVWDVGSLNNGGNATLNITATVTATGTITNTAEVTASDAADRDSTPNNHVAAEDDQDSATIAVGQVQQANLTISKSDTPDPVSVGNNITYTIQVSNGGPDAAQNVSVTDSLPSQLTFVSCSAPGGTCTNTGNNVTATYTSLANGASATVTIVAAVKRTVTNNTQITNTAEATSDTFDPSTPNSATTTTIAKSTPLLVISRFYGGSGASGIYRCDFVEIFNRGTASVDFTTTPYSLQYGSAAGNVGGTGTTANLHVINTGSIDPGEYYLVQLNCGSTTVGTPLPSADSTGAINPALDNGKLALVIGTTLLGVSCPSLPNANIADFVGYGSVSCSETAPTPALSTTKVGVRLNDGCTDTDNNFNDFTVNTHNNTSNPAPAPRNNSSPVKDCP